MKNSQNHNQILTKELETYVNLEDLEQTHCPIELIQFEEAMSNIQVELKSPQKSKKTSIKKARYRYDSIYRSLLRKFRKFYNVNFDKETRYKALKRYRNPIFFME
mmetsp:Transcript_16581/g.14482  ORF Transcript_16581/g.14482 Transcript_16581/m.14482 type:complete len:105 (+) Transcript_16581:331-645(+)